MPLWVSLIVLILCAALAVVSLRSYRRNGGKVFLALSVVLLLISATALLYAVATWLLVSSIK